VKKDTRRYIDRREYLIAAVAKRRKALKQKSVLYKGGKCQLCGYDKCVEAMDFHHIDSKSKKFGISGKEYTRSWQELEKELDKCMLVCANCHREIEAGVSQINPG